MTHHFVSQRDIACWLVAGGALASAIAGCASGAPANPSASGLSYAREACASCHAVEMGEALSPNVAAPPFQTLANRPDMSRAALSALLRSPHRNMPSLIVEPGRVDDLAAYFAVLAEQ